MIENPNKKLKLLPQDSNASETAGFVMVNYPVSTTDQNALREHEEHERAAAAAVHSQSVAVSGPVPNVEHSESLSPYQPVIRFGGAATDNEVQYVLETLSSPNPRAKDAKDGRHRKRRKKRKKKERVRGVSSAASSDRHGASTAASHAYHSDDEQQRAAYRQTRHPPPLNNKYSNTAPSTPQSVQGKYVNGKRRERGRKGKRRGSRSRKYRGGDRVQASVSRLRERV